MTRAARTYGDRLAHKRFDGIDVENPIAGYYRFRLRSGAIYGVVRVWHGPPHDPVTGEEMDRSWRWQAEYLGDPVPFERVWPECARRPVTQADYERALAQRRWAQNNAPDSAYADPTKKHDPLSDILPF